MIEQIYEKQLEAILFSVNQYSDDVVNSWISRVEPALDATPDSTGKPPAIAELFSLHSTITDIFAVDTVEGRVEKRIYSADETDETLSEKIDTALTREIGGVDKLVRYSRSGFRKVAVLNYDWGGGRQCLFFISSHNERARLVGLIIEPEIFVQEIVGPRLQVIAGDQFILSAFNKEVAAPVYSTAGTDTVSTAGESATKDFWLLPNYVLGIRTASSSLQGLVRERTYTNLTILLLVDVILIIAVILVYRNVRKEVQLAQNKAEFVSNVSHEIRTPLALISLFAETLEMGRVLSEEKRLEYYSIINKETRRLSDIVNKILNFSRSEANKRVLHIQSVNLVAEVREILNTYDVHLKNKGFEYALYTLNDSEIRVRADKDAFVEVVINLLDNAIKYSGDQKRIEIRLDADHEYGIVIIKDFGIGISRADQSRIFDKFYRVSTGDLAKSRGTGLGLALVKQLMEAQHGTVSVHSQPGKGSTFTLTFPIETK